MKTKPMKTIPTYCDNNYSSDNNLLKRKAFYNYFRPRVDLIKTIVKLGKLKGSEIILDLGCGNGDTLSSLREKYNHQGKMFGIDVAPGILNQAVKLNRKEKLNIKFSVGDGRLLKFPSDIFDVVIIKHVLHNVDNHQKVLLECYRVLKSNGKLILILTGKKSRMVQKRLKPKIAKLLNLDFFPEAESTVNLENIKSFLNKKLWDYKIIKLESRLILKKDGPYLDYIDSGRDFWGKVSNDDWNKVLEFSRKYFNDIIKKQGAIKDISTQGVVIATKS